MPALVAKRSRSQAWYSTQSSVMVLPVAPSGLLSTGNQKSFPL